MNIIGFIHNYKKEIYRIKNDLNHIFNKKHISIKDRLLFNEHLMRYMYNTTEGVIRDKGFKKYSGILDTTNYYITDNLSYFEDYHSNLSSIIDKKDFMKYSNNTAFAMVILQWTEQIEDNSDEDENLDEYEFYMNEYLVK